MKTVKREYYIPYPEFYMILAFLNALNPSEHNILLTSYLRFSNPSKIIYIAFFLLQIKLDPAMKPRNCSS